MTKIFNYRDHCFGIPNIEKYSEVPAPGMSPETLYNQTVALSFWQRERSWITERMSMPTELLLEWKLRRISQLVDYAFMNISFYKSIYTNVGFELGGIKSWSDFESLPIVTKNDMIANFPNNVVAAGFDRNNCRLIRSSGSSGKPVSLFVDRWREDLDTIYRMRAFERMGNFTLNPNDWTYSIHHGVWPYSSLLGNYPVFTISQDCPAIDIAKHIGLLRPKVISSIASFLTRLADTGIKLDELGVKFVSSNSETSTLNERLKLEKILSVPVLDEYSAEELGLIAMECQYHKYHAVEDDSHTEIICPDPTGLGEVISTDMWNHVMPFIRYQIGDLASWDVDAGKCKCGSTFRILNAVSGRADQAFFSGVNGKIAPGSLMEACDQFVVPSSSNLKEFRLIQHGERNVELIALPISDGIKMSPNHLSSLQERLNKLFGYAVELKITYVSVIPSEASYKRRTIICKFKR